jgi:hypothetical protein
MDQINGLEYGQILKLRKPGGKIVVEFRRCGDPVMDNMIDVWRYDSKKGGSKGKSSWILLKDLPLYSEMCIKEGFTEVVWETK